MTDINEKDFEKIETEDLNYYLSFVSPFMFLFL